jgi:hypothetical protein
MRIYGRTEVSSNTSSRCGYKSRYRILAKYCRAEGQVSSTVTRLVFNKSHPNMRKLNGTRGWYFALQAF